MSPVSGRKQKFLWRLYLCNKRHRLCYKLALKAFLRSAKRSVKKRIENEIAEIARLDYKTRISA